MKFTIESQLKQIMDDRGIKQSHFVKKFGINASTMSALYRGDSLPTIMSALIIAKELAVAVENIWSLNAEKSPNREG